MTSKIERDAVAADLAAVEILLEQMTDEDALTSLSLQDRRDELREMLASMATRTENKASANIYFSGRPVIGSRGIESEFGVAAVGIFQDIVTKVFAHRQIGNLAQRGAVPVKGLSKLHITNVVHGSFGFSLEELTPQSEIINSSLKEAMNHASLIIGSFSEPDEEKFMKEMEDLDSRVLATVREFFELMRGNAAAFRLVSDQFDKSFDLGAVERAAERAKFTTLTDVSLVFDGQLSGLFLDGRLFEYRTGSERGTIRGRIGPQFSSDDISKMARDWLETDSHATVDTKQVMRGDSVQHEAFTLVRIEARLFQLGAPRAILLPPH